MKQPVGSPYGIEEIYIFNQGKKERNIMKLAMCGITYPSKTYRIDRAYAITSCIEYVESGEGVICSDNNRFTVSAGDTYMLCSGENQHYWADEDNPFKKYWINLHGVGFKKLLELYHLEGVRHFPGLNLKDDLLEIIEISKSTDEDCTQRILEIVNRMLFKMYDHVYSASIETPAHTIRNYIDMHITEPFSLDDLIRISGKSESQVIRLFKKEFGVTPYAYHLNKRISLAKSMLDSTNLLVKDIADRLNFYDEYYFSNLFLKKTGLTPSQFRKKQKSDK